LLDTAARAQAVRLDVALQIIIRHGADALFGRLDGGHTGANSIDDVPRLLAGDRDSERVRRADGRPYLLAGRVTSDDDEALGSGRRNADVVAAKLRIGNGVTSRLRLQAGNPCIGKRLGHETLRLMLG
jgi:hypothetical protein